MKKTVLFCLLLVSYFAVAHIALTSVGGQHWAALIAIIPIAVWWFKALFAKDASSLGRIATLLIGLVAAGFGGWFWSRWVGYAEWVYLLQSAGSMLLMAGVFGVSLTMKEGDWVTRMATVIHGGSLPPEIARYTRSVTIAWTTFFLLMAATSMALFAWGQREWWSAFINIFSWPLVATAFLVEYGIRKILHPDFEHVSFSTTVRRVASALGNGGSPK